MAILFQIFNTFGVQNVQICILLALFIFSYLWVRKSWEERKKEHTRKIKLVDKIDQDGSNNRSENESEISEDEDAPALSEDLEFIPFEHTLLPEEEMIEKSMEFYKLLDKRRTLRFYSDKKVPKEVIENIVAAAGTAPSGAHTEPWTYVAVTNDAMKEEIRNIIEQEEMVNYEKRMGDKWTTDLAPLRTNWEKPYLTTAPVLILLFKQVFGWTENGKRKNHYYNEISCSISAGILLAAVHNAGLVTLTSTPLNCGPRLRTLLGRPANEKLLMLLPIGYPADDATVPKLQRKHLKEYMHLVE